LFYQLLWQSLLYEMQVSMWVKITLGLIAILILAQGFAIVRSQESCGPIAKIIVFFKPDKEKNP